MSTQIRYSLTPTWKAPAPVLEYPAPPLESASLWNPAITSADCIVLGFPWGSWDQGAIDWEQAAPDQVTGPLTGLLSSFALFDSNLLRWAAEPSHTLICLVPPPPPVPVEDFTRADTYTTMGTDGMLRLLGRRVRVLLGEELPRSPADLRPPSPGWWDELDALGTGDRFYLDEPLPRVRSRKAPNRRTTSQVRISGHEVLGAHPDFPAVGPALVARIGSAPVVFLLAKHPVDAEGVASLTRAVIALHEDARDRQRPVEQNLGAADANEPVEKSGAATRPSDPIYTVETTDTPSLPADNRVVILALSSSRRGGDGLPGVRPYGWLRETTLGRVAEDRPCVVLLAPSASDPPASRRKVPRGDARGVTNTGEFEQALTRKDIWDWVQGGARTLVWLLPGAVDPVQPGADHEQCLSAVQRVLGLSLARGTLPGLRSEDFEPSDIQAGTWWKELQPVWSDHYFEMPVTSTEGSRARSGGTTKGSKPPVPLDEARLLVHPQAAPNKGMALSLKAGTGRVVFLCARAPTNGMEVAALGAGALLLHSTVHPPRPGFPTPGVAWKFHPPKEERKVDQGATLVIPGVKEKHPEERLDPVDLSPEQTRFVELLYEARPKVVPHKEVWEHTKGKHVPIPMATGRGSTVSRPQWSPLSEVRDNVLVKMYNAGVASAWPMDHFRAKRGQGYFLRIPGEAE